MMNKAMVNRRLSQLLFAMLIATAIISQTAYAKFVIDDFKAGEPFHLYTDEYSGTDFIDQRGLPVPSGRRYINVYNRHNPAGTVTKADYDNTAGNDAIYFSGANIEIGRSGSSAEIMYVSSYPDPEMSFDPASYGDLFYVILKDDPGKDVSFTIWLMSNGWGYGGPGKVNLNGSGYYEIPISAYATFPGFDITDIDGLTLEFNFEGTQQQVAVTEWGIVPEPATLGLLAIGGLTILRRRRA